MTSALLGGIAALGSALAFAVASLFFRRVGETVSPIGTNLAKGLVAVAITLAVILARGMADLPLSAVLMLCASGIVGITIGDTAYFAALNALGPRRTVLLDTLGPGLTAVAAVFVLGERLDAWQWGAIVLTLAGVGWVMRERSDGGTAASAVTRTGVLWGLCSVGCHAAGVLLAKDALSLIPALEGSLVRQVVAVVAVAGWAGVRGGVGRHLAPLKNPRTMKLFLVAAISGSFLGIWLSMLGLRLTDASIAATLTATTPIFIVPLAAIWGGDRITPRAVAGAVVAVGGVAALLLFS